MTDSSRIIDHWYHFPFMTQNLMQCCNVAYHHHSSQPPLEKIISVTFSLTMFESVSFVTFNKTNTNSHSHHVSYYFHLKNCQNGTFFWMTTFSNIWRGSFSRIQFICLQKWHWILRESLTTIVTVIETCNKWMYVVNQTILPTI